MKFKAFREVTGLGPSGRRSAAQDFNDSDEQECDLVLHLKGSGIAMAVSSGRTLGDDTLLFRGHSKSSLYAVDIEDISLVEVKTRAKYPRP